MSEPRRDRAAARPGERSETEGLFCCGFDDSFCLSIPHRLRRSPLYTRGPPACGSLLACHSEERSDEESVLLRGFLSFCSFSPSQILRFAQDDTTSSFQYSARVVILRSAATKNLWLLRGGLFLRSSSLPQILRCAQDDKRRAPWGPPCPVFGYARSFSIWQAAR